ncbi:hypothetical protein NDA16_002985 [Ustilago loliicola]|nr:hypothetical protein NDA16_002985 [Ustilago loliicola]
MSTSNILRGDFRNPYPDLKGPGANQVVDSLLETVTKAKKRFRDPTKEDYEMARLSLSEIQTRLIEWKDITLTGLVEARIRLTVKASLETHCLTAFPYEKALEEAQWYQTTVIEDGDYDDISDITGCYPLFGLVFSVKYCIHVEGFPTTLGCSSRVGQNEAATVDLVKKMQDMGAIMIAKTTAPQLMMSNTTHSPLWSTTRSPVQAADADDKQSNEFQVGGSSGGETSLVKMGGSQIGLGTDMGGIAPGLLERDMSTLELVAKVIGGGESQDLDEDQKRMEEVDEDELEELEAKERNMPRIVYTTQKGSPEVHELVHRLLKIMQDGEENSRPEQCDPLGDIDLASWATAWTEHAKEHGFDDAREMLGDDPLITRTLFDESRLASTASESDKNSWKPNPERLDKLKETLVSQAGITDEVVEEPENVIFITPTYILGGPVQNKAFVELDDAGESEIWCQIFNLLDWPAISIPFARLAGKVRQEFRDKAASSPEWSKHLPGPIKADVINAKTGDGEQDRLPHLSLQLATLPGNHASLLDYARRITEVNK